jgi:hypothetical protein
LDYFKRTSLNKVSEDLPDIAAAAGGEPILASPYSRDVLEDIYGCYFETDLPLIPPCYCSDDTETDSDDEHLLKTPGSHRCSIPDAKSQCEKSLRNRMKAVQELVSTEETYCYMLKTLLDLVVYPLRESNKSSKKCILSQEDMSKLFCNVEEIYQFHSTLLSGLKDRIIFWHQDQKISDIFLTILPYLKIYKLYMSNYPTALKTLTQLRNGSKSAEFNKLLKGAYQSPRFKSLDLTSFLILPIQRVPRYILLLEQLVHFTESSHPDYADLVRCVLEVKKTTDHLNDELKKLEVQKKVLEIQNQLIGRSSQLSPLIHPARHFKAQANLLTPNMMIADHRVVFLFSDLLLIAKIPKSRKASPVYEYQEELDLWHAKVTIEQENELVTAIHRAKHGSINPEAFTSYSFKVKSGSKSYVLATKCEKERMYWVGLIQETIDILSNGGVRRRTSTAMDPGPSHDNSILDTSYSDGCISSTSLVGSPNSSFIASMKRRDSGTQLSTGSPSPSGSYLRSHSQRAGHMGRRSSLVNSVLTQAAVQVATSTMQTATSPPKSFHRLFYPSTQNEVTLPTHGFQSDQHAVQTLHQRSKSMDKGEPNLAQGRSSNTPAQMRAYSHPNYDLYTAGFSTPFADPPSASTTLQRKPSAHGTIDESLSGRSNSRNAYHRYSMATSPKSQYSNLSPEIARQMYGGCSNHLKSVSNLHHPGGSEAFAPTSFEKSLAHRSSTLFQSSLGLARHGSPKPNHPKSVLKSHGF